MIARSTLLVVACSVLWACGASAPPDAGTGGGAGGGAGACGSGQTRCGNACVVLTASNSNCGACGRVCGLTSQCVTGSCFRNDCLGADCADGQICSDDACLQRACVGVTCGLGTQCVEGVCVTDTCGQTSCNPGLACISGECVDAQCSGVVCGSGVCQFGRCVPGMTGGGGGTTGGGGGTTGGGGGTTGGGGGSGGGGSTGGGGGTTGGGGGTMDAGTDAGVDAGPPPVIIIFSSAFDGTAIASSPNSQPIYGRISGLPATNAQSCWETVTVLADGGNQSPDAGLCGTTDAAWLTLPDGRWSYNATDQLWRWVIPPPFPPNRYRAFARNVMSGTRAAPVVLELTGPTIIFSAAVDGPAQTDFVMSAPFYGRITGLSATNGLSCSEPATATNCLNQANFASLTTNGWTFTGSVWRKTFAINSTASGEYLHYARNTQDQSSAIPVLLTITP